MARQTYYVDRQVRHPLYKTRMLTAGQAIDLDASAARLFRQLGVGLNDKKPTRAKVEEPVEAEPAVEAPKPAPAKNAGQKARAKKAAAKK